MLDSELSRRELLARSAATAAGLGLSIALSANARRAYAETTATPDPKADEATLNALLSAEYDAIATYTAGAAILEGDTETPQSVRDTVAAVAQHFQAQHKQHADALRALIEADGGMPAPDTMKPQLPASFPASSARTSDVIKLATDKEKQAAFTYAQVLETISTQTAAKLVASIGGVETQHFVVLHLLASELATPTEKTAMKPELVVPAAFVVDVGLSDSLSLEDFRALDELLAFDPK